jgi:Type II secretion system (T2SS), protein M subtype b
MMRGTVTSKFIAVLLLALPLGLAAYFGSYLWAQWQNREADLAAIIDQYDRARAVASYNADSLKSADSNERIKLYALGEGTPAVLTANLQSKIRELAAQKSVDILQAGDLKFEVQEDGFARLGVHIEMSGNQEGVVSVIEQVQKARPWLFLDNIQFRSGYLVGATMAVEPPHFVSMDVWGIAPVDPKSLPNQ